MWKLTIFLLFNDTELSSLSHSKKAGIRGRHKSFLDFSFCVIFLKFYLISYVCNSEILLLKQSVKSLILEVDHIQKVKKLYAFDACFKLGYVNYSYEEPRRFKIVAP